MNNMMIIGVGMLVYISVTILIGIWIYRDACKRGIEPLLWIVVFLCSQGIGLILYLLVGRKNRSIQCQNCGKILPKEAQYCMNCGQTIDGGSVSVKIQTDPRSNILMGIILGLMAISIVVSIGLTLSRFVDKQYDFKHTTVFTGFYMTKDAKMSDRDWTIEAKKIMLDGKANATFDFAQGVPKLLSIQSTCDQGKLILHLEQGEVKQSVDITEFNNLTMYELKDFKPGEIKVSVEHQNVKNFEVIISW